MAEREDTEKASTEQPANDGAAQAVPSIDSPSISPAKSEDGAAAAPERQAAISLGSKPSLHRWLTPAAIGVAALIGTVIGAFATSHFAAPRPDAAAIAERHAMQDSIARLSREVGTLKAELTNASKSARAQAAQMAKLNETLTEKLARDTAAVTGSITPPQTTPPAVVSSPATQAAAPLPPQRPAAEIAARKESAERRETRLSGWSVLGARHGFVYVRSGRDIFRIAPGARLPGLGLVEEIRREDGRWIVVTTRGLIVADRGRRFYDGPY